MKNNKFQGVILKTKTFTFIFFNVYLKTMKMVTFYQRIKLFLVPAWILGVPLIASARQGGIVPCRGDVCDLCDLFILFDNLVSFVLFTIVPPVAVMMLVGGGLMLYFSVGDPKRMTSAKSLIKSTLMGIFIIYFAGLIVGLVFVATGAAGWERWWWGSVC